MAETPTYYVTKADDGTDVYHCCYCEQAGTEHHSRDRDLFLSHMAQRHDGRMVEDAEASAAAQKAPEEHPQGGPPGQTGEHPQGGPPGQAEEEVPEPTHPIAYPETPYPEQHEEPKP